MSAANGGFRNSLNKTGIDISPVLPLNSFGNVMMFLFNIVLATGIVFLNVSVLLSIIINRSLRRDSQYMYMLSTCLSDICTGVSYYYVGVFDVHEAVTGTYYIVPTFLLLSFMAVLAAQADRYHAVSAPFKYSQRMTRNRTLIVIFVFWVYAFTIVAVSNLVVARVAVQITGISTLMGNAFTVVIMLGLNIRLFFIAKFQLEKDPPSIEREQKRSSVYLIIVVAAFFIGAWSPVFIHSMVCSLFGGTCYTFKNLGTDPLRILPRLNAALTPVLYARGCSPLRESLFGNVWKGCCAKRRVSPETGRWSKVLRGRLFGVLVKS